MGIPPFPMGGSGSGSGSSSSAGTNLITGESRLFASTVGSWTATGNASLSQAAPSVIGFPAPYPASLSAGTSMKITTPGGGTSGANGAKLTLAGTYTAGKTYTFLVYVAAETAPSDYWTIRVTPSTGTASADSQANALGAYFGTSVPYQWTPVQVSWTCDTNTTSVDLKIFRSSNTAGSNNLHVLGGVYGGPRFIEFPAGMGLLPHPDLPQGIYTVASQEFAVIGDQRGTTQRNSPVLSVGPDTMYLDGYYAPDGPAEIYFGGAAGAGTMWHYGPGQSGTQADLQDEGVGFEVGTDYVGLMMSQGPGAWPNLTFQMYADYGNYMMQLRHRGTGGWSVSDDGTTHGRIEAYFQWERVVSGALTTGTNKAAHFQAPFKAKIDEVRIHVGTAPTGATLIVDVNDDGTTIFTTQANRPTIAISGTDATSGAADGGTAVDKDSVITVDIDQIGSTIAGSDLSVFIRGRYIW